MCDRRKLAAGLAALLLVLATSGAQARDGGNERNEQRDTQSRNEHSRMDHIPVRYGDGSFRVDLLVTIQVRLIHATDNFSRDIGIDFESLDRLDVSNVPLLGNLFDRPLGAQDFTEANRVGAVYRGADGTLVAVLDDDVEVGDSAISVVNGDGRYHIRTPPKPAEGPLRDLGELGELESIRQMISGEAERQLTMVLAGLTPTSVPGDAAGVPFLKDIPILQHLFRGTVHRSEDDELLILIRPSVIMQEEEQ